MTRAAVIVLTAISWGMASATLTAHPAPFSYLDLYLAQGGLTGSLIVHDFDVAHDVGVDPPERLRDPALARQYRDILTRLMDARLKLRVDGRSSAVEWTAFETLPQRQSLKLDFRIAGERPARVSTEATLFPYDPIHQTFINVYEDGQLRHQAILDGNRSSADYYAGTWQGASAVFAVFMPAGIEHIVIGPDHVLFLIGLLLLGGSIARLATIVTAFTIGHSVTLSLAALDVLTPSPALVEPLIALSIVFVGVDNLLVQRDRRVPDATDIHVGRHPRDIRAWTAGAFGLVHGFGFAGVLREIGLPLTALGWSLFSFNVGVEIGQLVIVVAVATMLSMLWRRHPAAARRVVLAGSVIVVAAGTYWFVERVLSFGGPS